MDFIRLDGGDITLALECTSGTPPKIIYWGKRLSLNARLEDLAGLAARPGSQGNADISIEGSISMENGLGLLAAPGLSAHRNGRDWAPYFRAVSGLKDGQTLHITTMDDVSHLSIEIIISMDEDTGIISAFSRLTNTGDAAIDVADMASLTMPIPAYLDEIISFSGRWAMEFQQSRTSRPPGSWVRENRRGRTSHDSFPAVILCDGQTSERFGEAYGLHFAWSGNHKIMVETLPDGRVFAKMGELLWPGELKLDPGESYQTPSLIGGYSDSGLNGLSQILHNYVTKSVLPRRFAAKPRPVHYNCWEAVYFDHDTDRLKSLATKAAELGVERFVLDDGWFGSRRNELSGLGDWYVSDTVYPEGLKPLIDHVRSLGMEMGLWFEPEMVNQDSDLFRQNPDWILSVETAAHVPFRHQYVLDICRPEVSNYLFERIDALLREYDIGYIKWDMNRDINHPGGQNGRPVAYTKALYALIDRINAAHPDVEIESCASGGGRIDYGILQRTSRVWTSDSNDALDRQRIQRGASYFLPLSILGSHVGPRRCHITERVLPMSVRAATAIMGHMGLELDLFEEPESDLEELQAAIGLYKKHRNLLHNGLLHRITFSYDLNAQCVISHDQTEAIYSFVQLDTAGRILPPRIHFRELDPKQSYRVRLIWPTKLDNRGYPAAIDQLGLMFDGAVVDGELLAQSGLQLAHMYPASALLLYLEAVD